MRYKIQKILNADWCSHILHLLAFGAFLFSTYVTFRYIEQPLADLHASRQTQTALTAYWMVKEGWELAYQTPVVGYPWSIPFEFPIYQSIVAAIVALTGFGLEPVGRFVSYVFLVACAWPAFAISSRLEFPKSVPWVFCALLWTAPLNVYWGRTFMIETTALFFTISCLPYGIDLIRGKGGSRSGVLFIIFATAAVLQKATTGGPVLLFLMLATVFIQIGTNGFDFQGFRRLFYQLVIICIPLIIGLVWTHYTDVVKMTNPYGSQLTSKSLRSWNFGSLSQRLDLETWRLIVWERSLKWNAGGSLGLILLILPWFGGQKYRRFAGLSFAAAILFIMPVLIFTNLHFRHEYYQVGCVLFLLGALAIVIGGWLKAMTGIKMIVPVMTGAIMTSNIISYNSWYGIFAAASIDELNPLSSEAYKVGRFLREHTPPDTGLVIFGRTWNSQVAFEAQRKSMTAPTDFKEYKQLWERPQAYLGGLKLGAIVIFPHTDEFPGIADMEERLRKEPEWIVVTGQGSVILLSPETSIRPKSVTSAVPGAITQK